jgi:3',5'-cyclic AMP phosphodiesterase CpdA
MSVLLQVSDAHFGTEQRPVVDALVRLAKQLKPDVLLLSGDITQRARSDQFAAAAAFVKRCKVRRCVAIPGNHDIPLFNVVGRALRPYAGFCRAFGPRLEHVVDLPDMLVVALNTTRPWRHKDGEVSARQVAESCRELRAASAKALRIVATHQPVHAIRESDERNLLHGREAAVPAWAAAGADLVLAGHIHLPYVRPLSERYRGLEREIWTANAGTAVSSRTRSGIPNSVNVVTHRPRAKERAYVERWDFASEKRGFERVERYPIPVHRPPAATK